MESEGCRVGVGHECLLSGESFAGPVGAHAKSDWPWSSGAVNVTNAISAALKSWSIGKLKQGYLRAILVGGSGKETREHLLPSNFAPFWTFT